MKISVGIIYNKGKIVSVPYIHTSVCTRVRELGYDVKMSFLLWS